MFFNIKKLAILTTLIIITNFSSSASEKEDPKKKLLKVTQREEHPFKFAKIEESSFPPNDKEDLFITELLKPFIELDAPKKLEEEAMLSLRQNEAEKKEATPIIKLINNEYIILAKDLDKIKDPKSRALKYSEYMKKKLEYAGKNSILNTFLYNHFEEIAKKKDGVEARVFQALLCLQCEFPKKLILDSYKNICAFLNQEHIPYKYKIDIAKIGEKLRREKMFIIDCMTNSQTFSFLEESLDHQDLFLKTDMSFDDKLYLEVVKIVIDTYEKKMNPNQMCFFDPYYKEKKIIELNVKITRIFKNNKEIYLQAILDTCKHGENLINIHKLYSHYEYVHKHSGDNNNLQSQAALGLAKLGMSYDLLQIEKKYIKTYLTTVLEKSNTSDSMAEAKIFSVELYSDEKTRKELSTSNKSKEDYFSQALSTLLGVIFDKNVRTKFQLMAADTYINLYFKKPESVQTGTDIVKVSFFLNDFFSKEKNLYDFEPSLISKIEKSKNHIAYALVEFFEESIY